MAHWTHKLAEWWRIRQGGIGQGTTRQVGTAAERFAAQQLKNQGYRILERNLRLPPGELDLVALHGEMLVFCEIRARRHMPDAHAAGASIHGGKRRKLRQLAASYLKRHPDLADRACRFDAVLLWEDHQVWQMEVVQDAFQDD